MRGARARPQIAAWGTATGCHLSGSTRSPLARKVWVRAVWYARVLHYSRFGAPQMRACVFVLWMAAVLVAQGLVESPVWAQTTPPDAAVNEAQAREAFQRGRIHYENGEFTAAAKAFEEAYALSGRDALLYNLYLAYRDANEQEKAAESLRQYLERVEVIENRAQLEARLRALEAGIAERKRAAEQDAESQAEPASDAQPVNVTATTSEPAEESGRWWLVPAIVTGAGAALMAGAIGPGMASKSKQDELKKECTNNVCDPSLKATADSGKTLSYVADALLFGGAAVAITGVVLLLVKKPKQRAEEAQPTVACSARGCTGAVSFRF